MELQGKVKNLKLPAFFPDATHGTVKSMPTFNLADSATQSVVVNAYHLYVDDLTDTIQKAGGIHNYANINGVVITDSGGFQVMSLVRRNPKNGKITDEGVKFVIEGKGSVYVSPEVSIDAQVKIGSDIVMCFDDCTEPFEPVKQQKLSVNRTIEWAKRCKKRFIEQTKDLEKKPYLFGIIQGGDSKELRTLCGEKLNEIGFDGFAFGGWPVDQNKVLLEEILQLTANLMPNDKPKYAMGVGKPVDIVKCYKMGYNMFDCVLPTRDARHERLYVFKSEPTKESVLSEDFHEYLYIGSGKYSKDYSPISEYCDCITCKTYSRSYLNHLFKTEPNVASTLATIHNLRFYSRLMEMLQ